MSAVVHTILEINNQLLIKRYFLYQ